MGSDIWRKNSCIEQALLPVPADVFFERAVRRDAIVVEGKQAITSFRLPLWLLVAAKVLEQSLGLRILLIPRDKAGMAKRNSHRHVPLNG